MYSTLHRLSYTCDQLICPSDSTLSGLDSIDAWTIILPRNFPEACWLKLIVEAMTSLAPLALLLALFVPAQLYHPECKNCVTMSKAERAMFAAHSEACRAESGATSDEVAALLAGRLEDTPVARRHVYCVLRRWKLIAKDGKVRKTAVMNKIMQRADEKNATKVLEECLEQGGDAPEDVAWNLFRCGYDKKQLLFEQLSAQGPPALNND